MIENNNSMDTSMEDVGMNSMDGKKNKERKKMGMIIGSSLIILMALVEGIRLYRRERKEKEIEEEFRKQQAMNNNA